MVLKNLPPLAWLTFNWEPIPHADAWGHILSPLRGVFGCASRDIVA